MLIHHDLQPNREAASKGMSTASSGIASVHVGNSRSYSVNRTSSTVVATSATSNAQPAANSLMSRDLKPFNKSMVQASHNTGGQASSSIPSRMSESVVMAETRGDKNLRGQDY